MTTTLLDQIQESICSLGYPEPLTRNLNQLSNYLVRLESEIVRLKEEKTAPPPASPAPVPPVTTVDFPVAEDFILHRNSLFRCNSAGKLDGKVYCRICRKAMFPLGRWMPFKCIPCTNFSTFQTFDLEKILAEIECGRTTTPPASHPPEDSSWEPAHSALHVQ